MYAPKKMKACKARKIMKALNARKKLVICKAR